MCVFSSMRWAGISSLLIEYLILVSGEIYSVFAFHKKNIKTLTGLKIVAISTVNAWKSREAFNVIGIFFTYLLLLLRVFNHESLSKYKILSFHSMLDAFRQLLLNADRKKSVITVTG